jgi:hypothetical protein
MSEHMSHEEYVATVRALAAETARSMIEGNLGFLEGARVLSSLRHEAEISDDDVDFMAFVVIDSETDGFPIGEVRKHWSIEALDKLDPEIKEAQEWARGVGFEACQSLILRFHV